MVSLADINQVLSKKRNLDSKLVLLKEFLNENNLDFCFFSLSKTFSKRFEISNFDLLEDYHQYSFFQDKQFGRLVEYLKEHGLYENTIIVFVADHGDLMGDFGGFFKNVMQEASTRVPFIISYPEGIKGGRVTDEFAGLQDVVPTVASLIGVELDREVDGVDLAPLLKDEEFIGRDYIISYSLSSPWQTYMVRKDNWKYIYSEGNGTEELYDIEKDSGEEWNLAAAPEHRETLQELKQIMIDWSVENGDTELLVDGQPAVTPVDLSECGFIAKTMGWRWY